MGEKAITLAGDEVTVTIEGVVFTLNASAVTEGDYLVFTQNTTYKASLHDSEGGPIGSGVEVTAGQKDIVVGDIDEGKVVV